VRRCRPRATNDPIRERHDPVRDHHRRLSSSASRLAVPDRVRTRPRPRALRARVP
jgi:hypothetical protein